MINAPVTSTVTEIVAQVSADGTTITPQVVRQEQVVAVVVQMGVKGDKGQDGDGGDMYQAVYDPTGKRGDAFDAGNLHGNIDGGTFN